MSRAFWALVRKEWLELVGHRHSRHVGLIQGVVFVGVLGVFVPAANSQHWLQNSPLTPLFFAYLPGIVAASVAADAFAGERERHTLETLLATALSELVILAGKAFAAVSYGVTIAACAIVASIITVNVSAGTYVPAPALVAGALGAAFASSLVMSSFAIIVSMKVPVARSAHLLTMLVSVTLLTGALSTWRALDLAVTWRNVAFAELCLTVLGMVAFHAARLAFKRERFLDAN